MIEETAARIFADHVDRALLERFEKGEWPARLWGLAVDNGLTMALAGEDAGGIGATWHDAYPILRGIGYWQVPLPLAETMIGALLLSAAGRAVPDGPIALVEEGEALALAGSGEAVRLSGTARRVPWARHCAHAVAVVGGQLVLANLADPATVRLTQRESPAREPDDEVAFDGARVLAAAANPFPDLAAPVRTLAAVAKSAMMAGALEWLLEQCVQYASDRVQFGRPIGKNQAIQQSIALMAGDAGAARMAALVACADAPDTAARACPAALFSAAAAKIRAGEAATRAASIAHQVHGAIGFTYEHQLNYATRRLWTWREASGSDAWWAERLGRAVIEARAAGFWPSMTRRQFAAMPSTMEH
ncbi:MAG: acyl-CoA dehydrogenase [Burkholderiales bacterium]|nr:acyl-CoA dehydrogenase [Burkholderiales bacterium]